ncbi:MAG: DNA repair protein Rad52, partial [Sulfurimonas sp.]
VAITANTQQANNHTQPYQQHNNPNQKPQHLPQDYSSLYNLGLTIMEQGNSLVVIGDDIFSKRDSIKACGFRWDGASKLWYKPLEQQAA